MLPRCFLLYVCQFNWFVNLLLLLLFIVLGNFNFNIGTFGSVKLKEMKIMLYMLPHCFLLYVCQFTLFINLLLLLLFMGFGCFNFNIGTFGSVKLKEIKMKFYICYHIVFSFTYASLTCSLYYYYCCYLLSLDASTLTQGPLGVLS